MKLAAPSEIESLVRKFERNHMDYISINYNEVHTRQEFINLFFKALGWDMYDGQCLPDASKEVLHEPSFNGCSNTISPDYAFKLEDSIKFLVEAKKPHVNLLKANPAYQIRNYAYNFRLPISIITNFEEFAVYDCRSPPKKTDNAETARICYMRYTEYIDCWDWISSKFSKTALLHEYLDEFLQDGRDDIAFQKEIISRWREELKSYPPKQLGQRC